MFYSEYESFLQEKYPSLKSHADLSFSSRNLVTPYEVPLPKEVLQKCIRFVQLTFKIAHLKAYEEAIRKFCYPEDQGILDASVNNFSVLMGYDFHIINNQPYLIEINTNSSGFLFAAALKELKTGDTEPLKKLKASFLKENAFPEKLSVILD
ncbi:MAG: hypothetical protein D6797_00760, partial [Bdellovibrio sp.]